MKSGSGNWTSPVSYGAAGRQRPHWLSFGLSRLVNDWIEDFIDRVAPCPWMDGAGMNTLGRGEALFERKPLYTAVQRQRRDASGWTLVQGILAPIQFAIFLVSLGLVLNYLSSGSGYGPAAVSVLIKTLALYAIMITGAIWEKEVFGKYLFADSFFWEDVFSMLVIALHTAYLAAMLADWSTPHGRMILALAAYAAYAINATQFLLKLRAARLEAPGPLARDGM